MIKKIFFYTSFFLLLTACQDKQLETYHTENPNVETLNVNNEGGAFNIKLSKSILQNIDNKQNELAIPTGSSDLDNYLISIGANKITRIFPYAGKHEAKHIEEGLNKWYSLWLNKLTEQQTRVLKNNTSKNIIEYIEAMPEPKLGEYEVKKLIPIKTRALSDTPFNDPQWNLQWNLHNTGSIGNYLNSKGEEIKSSLRGCDINITEAWRISQGTPNVIVAVVDGGIDIAHEDLKDNLWINKEEIPNNGIDDDNNGYIDDVNGYNFVDNSGTIIAQDHGTHVAGTIAAKNNNGKGICGIAGGNEQTNSGARIMSCQIFKPNPNYDPTNPRSRRTIGISDYKTMAAAIVYGADNGAVISQNSWGFDENVPEPLAIHEAINYFIKNAGNETNSPMKGGIVFFAAGNEETSSPIFPAANPAVIAVTSYTPNFKAAWYTNYGTWVDICAPGGSQPIRGLYPLESKRATSEVLSTLPTEAGNAQYGYMQGTSMACPHMSGIAALVVSKYGGNDFTNDKLKRMILSGVKDTNMNNYNTEKYADKLGSGFADAAIALQAINEKILPSTPMFLTDSIVSNYTSIKLGWRCNNVTEGSLFQYTLYYSKNIITKENFLEANVTSIIIPANYIKNEQAFTRVINDLSLNTSYYFALKVTARNGKESELVIHKEAISTKYNEPPIVKADINLTQPIEMAGNDIKEIILTLSDKENHKITVTPIKLYYVESSEKDNKIHIILRGERIPLGEHEFNVVVTDEVGAKTITKIKVNKKEDKAPQLKDSKTYFYIAKNEERTINMSSLITDEEPEELKFVLLSTQNSNITSLLKEQSLTLKGNKLGESSIKIKVTDIHNQSNIITIPIFVYLNKGIYSLFPTLADNVVYLKLGNEISGSFQIEIRDLAGKLVLKEAYHTNNVEPITRTIAFNIHKFLPGKYQIILHANNQYYSDSFIKR